MVGYNTPWCMPMATSMCVYCNYYFFCKTISFFLNSCGNGFSTKQRLERHQLIHTNTRPWVCEECGKAFRERRKLQMHEMIHQGAKPYGCKYCSSAFREIVALRRHLKKVHEALWWPISITFIIRVNPINILI